MKFKVGDEVEVGQNGRWNAGLFGRVVGIDHDEIEVEFPGVVDGGHSGNDHDFSIKNRWFFFDADEGGADHADHLTVITPMAKPSKGQAYLGNGKHTYEHVYSTDDTIVDRLRVPGGWLYRTATNAEYLWDDVGSTVNVVFVAMPEVVKHKV